MELNGSQIVLEVLKEQGVDTVFGYPGGTYSMSFINTAIHLIMFSLLTNRVLPMRQTAMPAQRARWACALQHPAPAQRIL